MSAVQKEFIQQIIKERFGPIVSEVAIQILIYPCSLYQLTQLCALPLSKIKEALCILIKFNLASFKLTTHNTASAMYSLQYDKVTLLVRYPKYLHHMKRKMGDDCETLLEEILLKGYASASHILLKSLQRLNKDNEDQPSNASLSKLKEKFDSLVVARYIMRYRDKMNDSVEHSSDPNWAFRKPPVDLKELTTHINMNVKLENIKFTDDGMYWVVNPDRFHQDMRDELIVKAISKKFDENAGELMRIFLEWMYNTTMPWANESNPVSMVEVKNIIRKQKKHPELVKFLDEYIALIAEDPNCFWFSDSRDTYQIRMKHIITLLTWETIEHMVTERFDSKVTRIFRLIKAQSAVELDAIQNIVMMPAKQAKLYTYTLYENNFIVAVDVKGGSSSSHVGTSKPTSLFRIKLGECVRSALQLCYKTLYNVQNRKVHEKSLNQSLIDKKQRVETILFGMRAQGTDEEELKSIEELIFPLEQELLDKITKMFKKVNTAELAVDDTIFLLELYLKYETNK